jgi:hypothetical protein
VGLDFDGPLDHYLTLWKTKDISFDFVDDMTGDPIVTLRIFTPVGPLTFMAQPVMAGRRWC